MSIQMRGYQEDTLQKTEAFWKRGGGSGIWHLFTGAGKSAITTHHIMLYWVTQLNMRAIIIGGLNRTLTYQMAHNFRNHFPQLKGTTQFRGDIRPYLGIVMGNTNEVNAQIVVASVQTLASKAETSLRSTLLPEDHPITSKDIEVDKDGNVRLSSLSKRRYLVSSRVDEMLAQGGTFDVWVHDEAHHSVADGSVKIIQRLQSIRELLSQAPMKIIGSTATPARSDDRGLHTLYDTIIASYDLNWGQRHGWLVPFADPQRVVINTEEYDDEGNALEIEQGVKSIRYVDNWADIVCQTVKDFPGRKWFGYWSQYNGASSVEDSVYLTAAMNQEGIRAAHVDGQKCIGPRGQVLPKSAQGVILEALAKGKLDVVNNVGVLIEGVDCPPVDGVLLGKRLGEKNRTEFTQIVGRVLRPAPGKVDAQIIDFTGLPLVVNSVADLMGFKVDPLSDAFVEDLRIEEIIKAFIEAWKTDTETVERWILLQNDFKEATVREAIELVLRGDRDRLSKQHIRALKLLVAYIEDEDKFMEGLDLKDVREIGKVRGKEQTYELVKIVRKSNAAWHHDDETALMSLSLAPGHAFVVNPPNHTWAAVASEMRELALQAIDDEDFEHPLFEGMDGEQKLKFLAFSQTCLELFESFTLWHVLLKGDRGKLPPRQLWINRDPALDILEDQSLAWAQENIPGYVSQFAEKKKKRSWKKGKATQKQLGKLARVAPNLDPTGYDKGEISNLINHYMAVPPVKEMILRFEKRIVQAKEVLHGWTDSNQL